jgi:hypothetical protein
MLQLTEEKTIFCYSETRVVSRFLGPQRGPKIPVTVTGEQQSGVAATSDRLVVDRLKGHRSILTSHIKDGLRATCRAPVLKWSPERL